MNLERLMRSNYIENTKLLYTGVERLYALWRGSSDAEERVSFTFDPQELWEHFYSLVKKEEADAKNQAEEWAHQNKLTDFFMFLQEELLAEAQAFQKATEEDAVRKLASKLLCLFAVTKDIEHNSHNAKIPYLFERLSNSMRDLAESDVCYLLYYRDDRLSTLSMSSYEQDILNYELDAADFLLLHRKQELAEQEMNAQAPLAKTIFKAGLWKKSMDKDPEQYFHILVLTLDAPGPEREGFYAVFQFRTPRPARTSWDFPAADPEPNPDLRLETKDIARMRNILFLNTTLASLLRDNLHILMTSQQTFQYVQPLSGPEKVSILHLTDLHIREKDRDALEKIFDRFPAAGPDNSPFDLLVITGDIVQGQCSAGELEAHYCLAERLIRKLAQRLWSCGTDGRYIRGDWRKRITIIPGNHDYASMNELEVIHQTGSRSTGVGRPAQKEGGPMVKFAYYLQFLHRLLGQDIGEPVRDWLNSVRYYDQMKLSLLCVNTVAGVGPLRNNKVHIDPDFVNKMKHVGQFQNSDTICLAHHTPVYQANYAADRYYTPKISSVQTLGQYVDDFRQILQNTDPQVASRQLDILYAKLLTEALIPEEDALMADVLFYRDNFREPDNERCEAIRSAMRRDQNMQQADHCNMLKCFCELAKIGKIKVFLGGHIHEVRLTEDYHCYEGPLFQTASNGYRYGVLTLDRTSTTHDWVCWEGSSKGSRPLPPASKYGVPTTTVNL